MKKYRTSAVYHSRQYKNQKKYLKIGCGCEDFGDGEKNFFFKNLGVEFPI